MARPKAPFEETATYEVYQCYHDYAMANDEIPNPHAFWEKILVPKLGYQMPWGSFQYHLMKLQILGKLIVNADTKAVRFPELDIVKKTPPQDLP